MKAFDLIGEREMLAFHKYADITLSNALFMSAYLLDPRYRGVNLSPQMVIFIICVCFKLIFVMLVFEVFVISLNNLKLLI